MLQVWLVTHCEIGFRRALAGSRTLKHGNKKTQELSGDSFCAQPADSDAVSWDESKLLEVGERYTGGSSEVDDHSVLTCRLRDPD